MVKPVKPSIFGNTMNSNNVTLLSKMNNKYTYDIIFNIDNFSNIYFKDITINTISHINALQSTIFLNNCSKLWIENCIIKTGSVGINTSQNSSIFIKNCTFIGGNNATTAIKIHPFSKDILILNSKFINFGNKNIFNYKGQSIICNFN